nr:MAG TPA: hypothetical protein [Caudoviricetes sp.]
MQTIQEKYNALISGVKKTGNIAGIHQSFTAGNYISSMCMHVLGSQALDAQKYKLFNYDPQTKTLSVNEEFKRPLTRCCVVFDVDKFMEIAGKDGEIDENHFIFEPEVRYFAFAKYADFHKNFTFVAPNITGHVTYNADTTETRFNGGTIDIPCSFSGNKNFRPININSGIGDVYKDYDIQVLTRYNYDDFIEKLKNKFGSGKLNLVNKDSNLLFRVNNGALYPTVEEQDDPSLLPIDYNKDFDTKMQRLAKSPDMKNINAIKLGPKIYK